MKLRVSALRGLADKTAIAVRNGARRTKLLQAVSQGLITSGEAVELSTVIDRLRQGLESSQIESRLRALEADAAKKAA